MAAIPLKSVNFEVVGTVQGVFFRKHTKIQAKKLGLCGWVKNTDTATVVGVIEGPEDKVAIMKKWLQETGSPTSNILKCVFSDEKIISSKSFPRFSVIKE